MRSLYVMSLLLVFSIINAEEIKIRRYDDFDIDAVVLEPTGIEKMVNCFLNTGPCDEPAATLKNYIREDVVTSCAACSDRKKYIVRRFMEALEFSLPALSVAFKKKYDPEGIYFGRLEVAVAGATKPL